MKYLLKGGLVVDPVSGKVNKMDLLMDDGEIIDLKEELAATDAKVLPIEGCYVFPGFVDMHCHLREPGEELKETILTGTQAAAKGGFTAVAAMGNTVPPADNSSVISFVKEKAKEASFPVYPIGCATKKMEGKEPSEIGDLVKAGAVALSDDGSSIMNGEILRRVMEYAQMFDIPVISHCEDMDLTGLGVMHEGANSTLLGLEGIPSASEDVHVARDIVIAELTGAHLHIAHASTAGAVELIRVAKKRGINVTAEVTPHHLCLTDDVVKEYDTNVKVKPPLRSSGDVAALVEGLKDGTIDAIATDHAPHRRDEKEVEFNLAPFGISGFETAVPLIWEHLVERGFIGVAELAQKMAYNPAKILGLPERVIKIGITAELTVIDPRSKKTVNVEQFLSLGKNSPFNGWVLHGWPVLTVAAGEIKYNSLS